MASKAIIDKNEKEELLGGKSSIVRQRYAKKKHVLLLCKVSTVIFLHYNMLNILQDVKCKLEVIFIALKLLFQNYACLLDKNVIAIFEQYFFAAGALNQSFRAVFNLM